MSTACRKLIAKVCGRDLACWFLPLMCGQALGQVIFPGLKDNQKREPLVCPI